MRNTMHKIIRFIFLFTFILPFGVAKAQNPGFFNYQAVVSDPDGKPFEGTVGIRISILQPSPDGEVVYSERHTKETAKGFVSFRVGEGDQVYTGEFDTIDWSAGPSYIRTEIAPGGGYAYSLSTTSELASVPLAMYAKRADSISHAFVEADPVFSGSVASMITAEDTLRWNLVSKRPKFRVGDMHQGGVIFFTEPGGEHGLVVSLSDVAEAVNWGTSSLETGAGSNFNGEMNTSEITSTYGAGNYAAYYCDTLILNGYDDWYLPAPDEMYLLFRAGYQINKILEQDANDQTEGITTGGYWTSRERNQNEAYLFLDGHLDYASKDIEVKVRAIRAF